MVEAEVSWRQLSDSEFGASRRAVSRVVMNVSAVLMQISSVLSAEVSPGSRFLNVARRTGSSRRLSTMRVVIVKCMPIPNRVVLIHIWFRFYGKQLIMMWCNCCHHFTLCLFIKDRAWYRLPDVISISDTVPVKSACSFSLIWKDAG